MSFSEIFTRELREPVVILFGPTASGKTAVLEALFTGAQAFCRAEVISADSMQVYRGMDIGTAKPDAALCAVLPHHLIDICEPDQQFNAGLFVHEAQNAVNSIAGRGALSVISGGTGFYLSNFIYGLPEAPPSSAAVRAELRREMEEDGADALWSELVKRDPVSACRIHQHDTLRLIRALEVFRLTGKPLSSYQSFLTADQSPRSHILVLALERSRTELYQRIASRCQAMFAQGLREEITALFKQGFTPDAPGLKAIGYREFFYRDDTGRYRLIDESKDSAIQEAILQNSRHYAKRQITYIKHMPLVQWITINDSPSGTKQALQDIQKKIEVFLRSV